MTLKYMPPSAWVCAQCGRSNEAHQGVCPQCAGPRTAGPGATAAATTARTKRTSRVLAGLGFALFWGVFTLMFVSPKACSLIGGPTAFDEALAQVRTCKKAAAALGSDIGAATVGCTTGKTRTGGGSGAASWSTSIQGSRASGNLRWSAIKNGGDWKVVSATLTVSGAPIDVIACNKKQSKSSSEDDDE